MINAEIAKNKNHAAKNEMLLSMHRSLGSKALDLSKWLILSEQWSRRANLEIQGVIKNDSESAVIDIVLKIGNAISEPIQECDIEACPRVLTQKADKSNVVVHFWYQAKRKNYPPESHKNWGFGLEDSDPVYVSETSAQHKRDCLHPLLIKCMSISGNLVIKFKDFYAAIWLLCSSIGNQQERPYQALVAGKQSCWISNRQ